MAKDYYLILGVPIDARQDEIRSAYRKLARRYHPDRRRESSSGAFQSISEAYDVLSDPTRRARYDRVLRGPERQRPAAVHPSARDPEPLVSDPVDVAGRPETVRPSLEALFDRLRSNFLNLEAPKAEREEPLNFELILSPEESERGVLVPLEIPVFSICRRCGGAGRDWMFRCEACEGAGRTIDREPVSVRVPAGVRDGTVLEISLERLGIHNLWLRVLVRVARQ